MTHFLIGLMYHEAEAWRLRTSGLLEDYESSTGVFIDAESERAALAWGEHVAQELMRHVNRDEAIGWREFGYYCWVEKSPAESSWSHCLEFFQHIDAGAHPDYDAMGTAAYERWYESRRREQGASQP